MSPEQARGERVGPYTDLYAVGVIAFELLTGRLPFEAPSPVELLNKHLNEPAPPLRQHLPSAPPALEALIAELLQKDPHARPRATDAVRARLKPIARDLAEQGTRIGAAPKSGPPRKVPAQAEGAERTALSPRRRSRLWLAAAIPAGLALVGGGAFLALRHSPPRAAVGSSHRDPAVDEVALVAPEPGHPEARPVPAPNRPPEPAVAPEPVRSAEAKATEPERPAAAPSPVRPVRPDPAPAARPRPAEHKAARPAPPPPESGAAPNREALRKRAAGYEALLDPSKSLERGMLLTIRDQLDRASGPAALDEVAHQLDLFQQRYLPQAK
jgi:serine/threonine-protein kinase